MPAASAALHQLAVLCRVSPWVAAVAAAAGIRRRVAVDLARGRGTAVRGAAGRGWRVS
jgi:hypothetical protein